MGLRTTFRVRRSLLCAALLTASCEQGVPLPGSGTIEGMDLGLELGLDLKRLVPAEAQADPELFRRVAQRAELEVRQPPRIFEAETQLGEERVSLRIVVLALPEGARLAVAADHENVVRASALWGTPELDEDPDGAWQTFRFQFHDGPEALRLEETLPPSGIDGYWSALQADPSPEASVARAVYRHRQLMSANSQFVRSIMRRTARGELPPRDWFRRWKENFADVAELSPELGGVLGEHAGDRHYRLAHEAADRLDEIVTALETQEPRAVRRLVSGSFYRQSCKACHEVRSDALGGDEIFDGVRSRFDELGVRLDVRRVGLDLWAVPGQEKASQYAANAFKAAFLLLGEVPQG